MSQLKLLQSANPILFSPEQYDQYPTSYNELRQYLEQQHTPERPATIVDYLDSIVYRDEDNDVDLKRKLNVEYALYKCKTLGVTEASFEQMRSWCQQIDRQNKQAGRKPNTEEKLYGSLLALIESVSVENTSALSFNSGSSSHTNDEHDRSISSSKHIQQSQIDELTSYLISSALQKGIDLKPENHHQQLQDDTTFLKQCIESLLAKCNAREPSDSNSSIDKTSSELKLALKDLQLAHSFLTKKFEGDRNEYIHNIERLSKTNKELSHELLNYHSQLNGLKENCKSLENQKEKLKEQVFQASIATPGTSSSLERAFSPSPTSDASSPPGNSRPYSLGIMRTEFKKILGETQKKYEQELHKERQMRKQLEQELAERK